MNKIKKIAYVTGTRADFGLMTPLLHSVKKNKKIQLQVYATGMHIMKKFGNTYKLVQKEFPNTKKINATFNDTSSGLASFSSKFLQEVTKKFIANRPDFVLILGDRPEMLCTALACTYLHIPTGHVHGGERTSTVDDSARHAITKLANLHFPATKESATRIKKMGEETWRIHQIGAPALDVILNTKLPSKKQLFNKLKIKGDKKPILVTLHPISQQWAKSGFHMKETLKAVIKFKREIVISYPNADTGSKAMIKEINKVKNISNIRVIPNLEYKYFLALERESAVWIGNSSAAMIESASFKTPVVNIGPRQKDRQRGKNVIDVRYNNVEIYNAIKKSLGRQYVNKMKKITNPWGDGKASGKITQILEKIEINEKLLSKKLTYV